MNSLSLGNLSLGMTIEVVLGTLLIATIYYCYSINKRISDVIHFETEKKALDESLEAKIAEGKKLHQDLHFVLNDLQRSQRAASVRSQENMRVASPSLTPSLNDNSLPVSLLDRARALNEKRVSNRVEI